MDRQSTSTSIIDQKWVKDIRTWVKKTFVPKTSYNSPQEVLDHLRQLRDKDLNRLWEHIFYTKGLMPSPYDDDGMLSLMDKLKGKVSAELREAKGVLDEAIGSMSTILSSFTPGTYEYESDPSVREFYQRKNPTDPEAAVLLGFEEKAREYLPKVEAILSGKLLRTISKFMDRADRARFDSYFKDVAAVSNYGSSSAAEDFAEVFSHFLMGKDMTRDQIERFKAFLAKKDRGRFARKVASTYALKVALETKRWGPFVFEIDRPKGFVKTWDQPDGTVKKYKYPVDYGYFKGHTDPGDGEGLDAFVGDDPQGKIESFLKMKEEDGKLVPDETKFMVGLTEPQREKVLGLYKPEEVTNLREYEDFYELVEVLEDYKDKKAKKSAAVPDKYKHIDFKPPQSVADTAAKGLEYRQKASPSNRGGLTPAQAAEEGVGSGVQRAVNLKNRDNVSPEVIKKMVAFFARHEKNKGVAPEHKSEPWNDKGHVAWLIWGGDPGRAWAEKVKGQMEDADEGSKKAASHHYLNKRSLEEQIFSLESLWADVQVTLDTFTAVVPMPHVGRIARDLKSQEDLFRACVRGMRHCEGLIQRCRTYLQIQVDEDVLRFLGDAQNLYEKFRGALSTAKQVVSALRQKILPKDLKEMADAVLSDLHGRLKYPTQATATVAPRYIQTDLGGRVVSSLTFDVYFTVYPPPGGSVQQARQFVLTQGTLGDTSVYLTLMDLGYTVRVRTADEAMKKIIKVLRIDDPLNSI